MLRYRLLPKYGFLDMQEELGNGWKSPISSGDGEFSSLFDGLNSCIAGVGRVSSYPQIPITSMYG